MDIVEFNETPEAAQSSALLQGQEWNVHVPSGAKLTVTVKYGIVEILGTELANDIPYTFQGISVNIYAIERSLIEWKCLEELEPVLSENKSYHTYVYNLSFALERLKLLSFNGPRLLILGQRSTGKSSLAHILCSYALKIKQYQPLLVNLNPQEGVFSLPGSITATPISEILDVESSIWGQSITTGATKLHDKQPLVKNFGLENIEDNRPLYLSTISQLASGVQQRLKNDPVVRRSGLIIDTPDISRFDTDTWSEVRHIIEQFEINAIVVCADTDELAIKLSENFKTKVGHFVRIPPPGSITKIDGIMRRALQRIQIREYFYGTTETVLSPYTMGAGFEEITIFKPRNLSEYGGTQQEIDLTVFDKVEVNASNLQHSIVAITNISRKDTQDKLNTASIIGYGLITEVNDSKRKLRVLLPVPSRIPDRAMILTEYRYLE
ncbi:unnamed protein product [Kluyveromyces dobzhanskii CBS 2104]|uniref:Polynucleotide 5'-hydroxyl-kinase GRC3 n=1 Tax=Kluyveromyces dobzhanskii CBS 2104 TaxID=1427455 RepID=A0A0A8L4K3_9SACH|nr:unnamed protein product [Kluyveromyces dobzhanskii CBS 2104]